MRIRWRGFELPTRCLPVKESMTASYGKFIIESFERGFGHTLGNGFRRILLSSIEGAAVTAVRLEGVDHAFTTIPGVFQDVQEFVLNLKELNFRLTGEVNKVDVNIEKKGAGDITGADVQCPAGAEVVNPGHVIGTKTEAKGTFRALLVVEKNRGYLSAEENEERLKTQEQPVGFIAIDATFSPILRVQYAVEDTRVGKITDYDKLVMEVWTDGTIYPEDAMLEAANVYRKHLNCFTRYREVGMELEEKRKPGLADEKVRKAQDELKAKFATAIDGIGLSVRTLNCLATKGIKTIGEIAAMPEAEVEKIRNFGKTSAKELKNKLVELGLNFEMDLEDELLKLEERGVE
ncbi:MAG: DNA-directed RNA polymerase subunit alpha [Planctomycetota bacterium]